MLEQNQEIIAEEISQQLSEIKTATGERRAQLSRSLVRLIAETLSSTILCEAKQPDLDLVRAFGLHPDLASWFFECMLHYAEGASAADAFQERGRSGRPSQPQRDRLLYQAVVDLVDDDLNVSSASHAIAERLVTGRIPGLEAAELSAESIRAIYYSQKKESSQSSENADENLELETTDPEIAKAFLDRIFAELTSEDSEIRNSAIAKIHEYRVHDFDNAQSSKFWPFITKLVNGDQRVLDWLLEADRRIASGESPNEALGWIEPAG